MWTNLVKEKIEQLKYFGSIFLYIPKGFCSTLVVKKRLWHTSSYCSFTAKSKDFFSAYSRIRKEYKPYFPEYKTTLIMRCVSFWRYKTFNKIVLITEALSLLKEKLEILLLKQNRNPTSVQFDDVWLFDKCFGPQSVSVVKTLRDTYYVSIYFLCGRTQTELKVKLDFLSTFRATLKDKLWTDLKQSLV